MNMKTIPKFENEDQERDFWAGQDSTEVVDWAKAQPVTFANLDRAHGDDTCRKS
jgi:hypothetical protein